MTPNDIFFLNCEKNINDFVLKFQDIVNYIIKSIFTPFFKIKKNSLRRYFELYLERRSGVIWHNGQFLSKFWNLAWVVGPGLCIITLAEKQLSRKQTILHRIGVFTDDASYEKKFFFLHHQSKIKKYIQIS